MRRIMLVSFLIFPLCSVSLTTASAQSNVKLTSFEHLKIDEFFSSVISPDSQATFDSISYSMEFRLLYKDVSLRGRNGVYVVTIPMDPKTEFVCLLDKKITLLRTENFEDDLPIIITYLKDNDIKIKNNDIFKLLNDLSKVYKERNPKSNEYLPR